MFRALGNTRYGGCRKFRLYHVKIHEFSFHLSYWDLPASTVMGVKFAFEKKLYRFFKQFWVKMGIYSMIYSIYSDSMKCIVINRVGIVLSPQTT